MRSFAVIFLFAMGCFSNLSGQQAPPPPNFPNEATGSLEFDTTAGKSRIGAGSFVQIKETGRCYILTVRHLLGPNKDFAQAVAPEDVPKTVKGIQFESLAGTGHYYSVTGLVFKPAGSMNDDPVFDLAAYPVATHPDQTLVLAEAPPVSGDTVWIVGQVRSGAPAGEIAHSAKVLKNSSSNSSSWLLAVWGNDKIDSYGASGAPVLNAAGQMVGIDSGHSMWNGHKVAFIIPATAILSAITSSERSSPSQ